MMVGPSSALRRDSRVLCYSIRKREGAFSKPDMGADAADPEGHQFIRNDFEESFSMGAGDIHAMEHKTEHAVRCEPGASSMVIE